MCIFKKKQGLNMSNEQNKNENVNANEATYKYHNPQILCVDMSPSVIEKLQNDGFNVDVGTFGLNYSAKKGQPCGFNGDLPYLIEKDIVIVNLNRDKSLVGTNPESNQKLSKADRFVYSIQERQNYFNPAFLYSMRFRNEFKKVIKSGGIIIVFSSILDKERYYRYEIADGSVRGLTKDNIDNYGWLPTNLFPITSATGREVFIDEKYREITEVIFKQCIDKIEYDCVFPHITNDSDNLILLNNKVGEVISFLRIEKCDDNEGYYIFLPQCEDMYMPLSNLFREVLPLYKPELFPDFTKSSWLETDEYIFPKEREAILEKENIILEYESKLKEADIKIKSLKDEYSFLTNILISQGFDDFLVNNVYKVLEFIGYKNIVKVDDIIDGNKQEDLRIIDNGRFAVIEIKGHNGNPTEDDCQALLKYINRNMRKEKRHDIQGVLIVNHQKLIEPMKRNCPAYTKEQIADAERDNYTLVDTWQLFQATRLLQEGLTSFSEIDKDLFTPGLFNAIPSSWRCLGKIDNYYKKPMVVGMLLELNEIKVNDEIIIQNGNEYFTQKIASIRINDVEVNSAKKGDAISFKVDRPINKQAIIYTK